MARRFRSIPQYCSFVIAAGIVALIVKPLSTMFVIHAGPWT